MSKHELLDYMFNNPKSTMSEIAESFAISHTSMSNRFKRLQSSGQVRILGKLKSDKKARKHIIYELTEYGIKTLNYYNTNGCNNDYCLCKQSK